VNMRVNLREPRSARWLKDISIRLKVGSVRLMHLVVPDKERTRERKIRRNWWKIAKAVIGSGNIAEAPVGQNSSGEKPVDVKAEEQITHTGMVSEVVPEKENNVQKDTSGAGEPHKRLGGAVGRDGPAVNSPEKANECAKEGYTNTATPKALLTGVTTSKAPEIQYSTVTDYEKAQSIFEKINEERINAIKSYADVAKQKTCLLQQISQYQDEIDGLKAVLSQQNAEYPTESNKQNNVGKEIDSQKATMKLEKQDLEAKTGKLMQRIDELAKAASTAKEEMNSVKARILGQQNRVAELEGQIKIMKQVEDGRKKQLDETLHHNEDLWRQNADFKAKIVQEESELTRLRREVATIGAENSQLRAAVVERVLSTPTPQGTPPASDSPATKREDFKNE
jgi:predicted nuclease with TOPRIM domain